MYGPKNGAQAKLSRKLKCPIALYGLAPQHALAQPTSTPLSSVMVRRSIICNSLRRVNAAWLSRSERRAYAYSTLRPPTFSGDSLASAVWLTVRPTGADHQWKEDLEMEDLDVRVAELECTAGLAKSSERLLGNDEDDRQTNKAAHCCPVRSQTESTGCQYQVIVPGSPMLGVPVKWAFFQKG